MPLLICVHAFIFAHARLRRDRHTHKHTNSARDGNICVPLRVCFQCLYAMFIGRHFCCCLFACISVYILSINFNDIILCYYSILFLFLHSASIVPGLLHCVVYRHFLDASPHSSFYSHIRFVSAHLFIYKIYLHFCYHLQTFLSSPLSLLVSILFDSLTFSPFVFMIFSLYFIELFQLT